MVNGGGVMLDPVVERLVEQVLDDEITVADAVRISGLPVCEFGELALAAIAQKKQEIIDLAGKIGSAVKRRVEAIAEGA